jgi:uncharacterized DUF497 family protein
VEEPDEGVNKITTGKTEMEVSVEDAVEEEEDEVVVVVREVDEEEVEPRSKDPARVVDNRFHFFLYSLLPLARIFYSLSVL